MAKLLSGTRIYGTAVVDTQLSINGGIATSSTGSGSLQVFGGAGISGGVFVGGIVTATLFSGTSTQVQTQIQTANASHYLTFVTANNATAAGMSVYTTSSFAINPATGAIAFGGVSNYGSSGQILQSNGNATPTWVSLSGVASGSATTATNLASGTAGQVPYQTAPGLTSFISTATTGNFLQANYVGAPTWTTTASMYVSNAVTSTNLRAGTSGQLHYQSAADTTAFLGTATTGNFLQANYIGAPTWTTTASMYVANAVTSTNLRSGIANQLVYQSAADTSGFISTATTGNFLQATTNSTPAWTTTANIYVANAVVSTNLRAGTAGQLHYQSAADTSGFISTATTGNFLQATTNGTPAWTTTGSMYVNSAVNAQTLYAGTAGQLVYQSAANTTAFLGTATTGNFLQANYIGAPTWTTTSSMQVGYAANILGVGTGGILYESANNTTSILSTGTSGQLLMAAGGAPIFTNTSSIYVNSAVNAQNLYGGVAGSIPMQTATGVTGFISTGTSGYVLTMGTNLASWQSLSGLASGSATTATNLAGGTAGQIPYQSAPGTTLFANSGTTGQFWQATTNGAPAWTTTANIYVANAAIATNVRAGIANQLVYQSAADTSGFISTATTGNFLQATTNGTPAWTSTASMYVANAVTSTNLRAGTAGQLHYQSAADTSGFISTATTGNFLQATTNGTPAWTTTASMYVNSAVNAQNLYAGTAGQLVYQSAANTSGFVGPGTAGQLLVSAGASAPVYTNTSSIYVQDSNVSTNIRAGTAGQLVYQSAANTSGFVGPGTAGQILVSAGPSAPVYTNTGSIYVGNSAKVDTVLQTANASYYPAFVSTNNATPASMSVYTTSSFSINPQTGGLTATTMTASSNAYNTATAASNAIYTSGGIYAGAGLTVAGPTLFKDTVTFSGTATYVYSTNTVYTDNIIEMHTPPGGVSALWYSDDGKDIGFRFHYYTNTTDTNAALVLANDTKYLEWYNTGAENTTSNFSSATYGTFKTGAIKLVGGTANSGNTSSGDLTVLGGVGIGGSMYVGGNITVAGTINASITGVSTTATNIAGGLANQIHYQTSPGITGFISTATTGNFLQATTNGTPAWTTTANIYVNRATLADSATTSTNAATAYSTIASLSTGTGIFGGTFNGSTAQTFSLNTATLMAISVNLAGGTAGQLHYQSAANTTAFLGTATTGNFLQANYIGAPTWTTTGSMYVGNSAKVDTVLQATSATYYPTFVSTNNASAAAMSVYTTSSFVINPATGYVGIGTASPTAKLAAALSGDISDPVLSIRRNNNAGGGLGNPEIGIDVSIPNTYNSASTTTGIKVYVNHNLGGEHYGGYFETAGNPYSNGIAVYAKTTHSDTNGPGYQPAIFADAYSVIGVSNAGYAVGLRARTNNYVNNVNIVAESLYTGTLTQTVLSILRNSVNVGSIRTSSAASSYYTSNSSGIIGIDATNLSINTNSAERMRITSAGGISFGASGTAYGTSGQILQSNGDAAPTWVSASGVTAGTATTATAVNTIAQTANANYYPTFVDSNNATATGESVYTTSSFYINARDGIANANGFIAIGTSPPASTTVNFGVYSSGAWINSPTGTTGYLATAGGGVLSWSSTAVRIPTPTTASSTTTGALIVTGGLGLGGDFYSAGKHIIQNGTNATSTTTGALQIVNGGAGIGGDVYAGGDIYSRGVKVVGLNIQEFTATASQTTFTVTNGYTVGTVQLFANGIQLGSGAFVASNGTTVVVNTARNAGDIIRVISGGTSTQANNIQSYSLAMSVALGA